MDKIVIDTRGYKDKERSLVESIIRKNLFAGKAIKYDNIEMLSTKYFPEGILVNIIRGKSSGTVINTRFKQYDEIYGDIKEYFLNQNEDKTFEHKKEVYFKNISGK